MLVNAVFDKEPSSATKGLLHAFEAVFVMRKNSGRKAASGALKNPFREKSSADGRIIKKWCEQRGKSGFWLPDSSKTGRAAPKVEQNLQKLEKCSTRLPSPKQCGLRLRANLLHIRNRRFARNITQVQ